MDGLAITGVTVCAGKVLLVTVDIVVVTIVVVVVAVVVVVTATIELCKYRVRVGRGFI